MAPSATVDPLTTTSWEPIADGVDRHHGRWITSDGLQAVELITVDPAAPGISLETALPAGGVDGRETVTGQASRRSRDGHRVIAAINGDVFRQDPASKGWSPNGLQVQAGELITGSTKPWPTVGLDGAEQPRMGDVAVSATARLPGNVSLRIDRVNKWRRSGDLVLFTRRWGTSTGTVDGGTEVILGGATLPLRPSGSWTATVQAVRTGNGDADITSGAMVLSADGSDESALRTLSKGSTVTITTSITPGWDDVQVAIGGREWLVDDGAIGVRPVSEVTLATHPRTAVGIRADGDLVLATVDGRQSAYSMGVTATDLAEILHDQGATDAIMLDGGGSTTLLARRPGDIEASLQNRPSDGHERRVANSLLVVSSISTGPLARLVVRPFDALAVVGERTPFQVGGVDAAGNGVPVDAGAATWSLGGKGGSLDSTGGFRATEPGSATVSATIAQDTATATVTTVADTFVPLVMPPVIALRSSTVDSIAVPVTVGWPRAADIGTGVAGYELEQRFDDGPWSAVALLTPTTRSVDLSLPASRTAGFRLRATDGAGNVSRWIEAQAIRLRLVAERSSTIRYAGRWRTAHASVYLGGASRWSRVARSMARFAFRGRGIAWVAARGPTRGTAKVYIDGRYVARIRLSAATPRYRQAVFTRAWPTTGGHRITIRVRGTAGHPRVDLDGFVVMD